MTRELWSFVAILVIGLAARIVVDALHRTKRARRMLAEWHAQAVDYRRGMGRKAL